MREGSKFVVNLGNLKYNYELLRKLAPNNEIIFMVKANAYGHGLSEIVDFSFHKLGILNFGVACLAEAVYLKNKFPSSAFKIWVFSDLEIQTENSFDIYRENGFLPVLSCFEQLKLFVHYKKHHDIPLVLKFDTGMNRLGIKHTDIDLVIDLLQKNQISCIEHLMTHFASSFLSKKEGDKTALQLSRFQKLKSSLQEASFTIKQSSCSNSGAIEQEIGLEESHIRPGLMLYGPRSVGSFKASEAKWFGRMVASLYSTILKVEKIQAGTPIGYGAQVYQKNGSLVYLPIGYGDGFLTYYSGVELRYKNFVGTVFGRVNMDLIAVVFEGVDPREFKVGDKLDIWDDSCDRLVEFSNQTKSIPYQVLTAITNRIPKEFLNY
jgi:alanine racemase